MNVLEYLRRQFAVALAPLTDRAAEFATHVRPAQDAKFGDYQANCAMPLAAALGTKPRELAPKIIAGLPNPTDFAKIDIAGPGFINLRLSDAFLIARLAEQARDPNLGVEPPVQPATMVVDFSSPNVAKPMHVGHLRSTIIGDAIARIHRALGWKVITDNHLGDWGTQFGMLIHGWRHHRDDANAKADPLGELARLYRLVNQLAETDAAVAEAARRETAKLHEGDTENLALWKEFMPWCLADIERIYRRLDIRFDHQLGESFYQPMLAAVVKDLRQRGLAEESQGAICVFFPDLEKVDAENKPIQRMAPSIVRKEDGAFTYATSDLACIRYRIDEFKADVLVYVVDDRQSLHFEQLFDIARRWGYDRVKLVHVAFGKIMGRDNKPFKTREGGTVSLEGLLDEAVARAQEKLAEIAKDRPAEEQLPRDLWDRVAESVGIGAVKYADLSQNRASDYVFDWDKMISLSGNTSTYLQYVYARNRSIFRRGNVDPATLSDNLPALSVAHPSERALAVQLVSFPESLAQAAADFKPNVLTSYLYELANRYNSFFRDCPVLKADSDALRASRLVLCELTARVIQHGLSLLGIRVLDRM